MTSQNYINEIIEKFRFFDDLAPEVRKAIREANYEWNPIEIMSIQHQYYQNGLTMEDLASTIKEKDLYTFIIRTKTKLRELDEPPTGNS